MASSGYTDIYVTKWDTLRFNWWQIEQSISGNYTKIGWNTQLISGAYGAISSTTAKSWNASINGSYYSSDITGTNTVGIGNNTTKSLTSGETIIYHNDDGTKQFSYSFSQYFGITFDSWVGTVSGSGTGTLDTIPRKSSISITNGIIGTQTTITITRASSSFTHTVKYAMGSLTGTIVTKDARTSIPWIIPHEFYSQIPSATAAWGSVWCETYDANGNYIGTSDNCRLIAYADEASSKPTLNPAAYVVEDDDYNKSIELTGNNKTIIKGYSDIMVSTGSTAQNYSWITSNSITCGTKVLNSNYGKIEKAESSIITFTASDSRGYSTSTNMSDMGFVDYVKLTCGFDHDINFTEDAEDKIDISININGNFFNDTFGKIHNDITLAYQYKVDNGPWSGWIHPMADMGLEPTFDGNTYSLNFVALSGVDYGGTYTFQCAASDKISYVESSDYAIKAMPVFDWGENDFNFNVPVNAPAMTIQGKTVNKRNDLSRVSTAFTQRTDISYAANSYINLFQSDSGISTQNDFATFNDNGLITFNKDMLVLVNIHVVSQNPNGRAWIRLMNYANNWKFTDCITYGNYTTSQITIILNVTKDQKIGVSTSEPMIINSSGLTGSYIELYEL